MKIEIGQDKLDKPDKEINYFIYLKKSLCKQVIIKTSLTSSCREILNPPNTVNTLFILQQTTYLNVWWNIVSYCKNVQVNTRPEVHNLVNSSCVSEILHHMHYPRLRRDFSVCYIPDRPLSRKQPLPHEFVEHTTFKVILAIGKKLDCWMWGTGKRIVLDIL